MMPLSACASIRKLTALGRDYSHRRAVFGAKLVDNPLHLRTLSMMELHRRACMAMTFDVVSLMGRVDTSAGQGDVLGGPGVTGSLLSAQGALNVVRLMTPIVKAYTAKVAIYCATEGVELFGGQGYIEDTGLPAILRDAQVLPIWEGTTNVLSMDTLRVLAKSKFAAFAEVEKLIRERCAMVSTQPLLKAAADSIVAGLDALSSFLKENFGKTLTVEASARELTMSIGRLYAASCLLARSVVQRALGRSRGQEILLRVGPCDR